MSVRVSVLKIYIKNIEPINFIFGGGFPCGPGRKQFDFEKITLGVRVGVGLWGCRNLALVITGEKFLGG